MIREGAIVTQASAEDHHLAVGRSISVKTLPLAISATWIGGSLANNGARDLQREQAKREEDRQTDAARAVARVVLIDLQNLAFSVGSAASGACSWPLDYTFTIDPNDRKSLARRVAVPDEDALSGDGRRSGSR